MFYLSLTFGKKCMYEVLTRHYSYEMNNFIIGNFCTTIELYSILLHTRLFLLPTNALHFTFEKSRCAMLFLLNISIE